nr:MAG TPA: hypothetical protein [Caudoviricetes sp.]
MSQSVQFEEYQFYILYTYAGHTHIISVSVSFYNQILANANF